MERIAQPCALSLQRTCTRRPPPNATQACTQLTDQLEPACLPCHPFAFIALRQVGVVGAGLRPHHAHILLRWVKLDGHIMQQSLFCLSQEVLKCNFFSGASMFIAHAC